MCEDPAEEEAQGGKIKDDHLEGGEANEGPGEHSATVTNVEIQQEDDDGVDQGGEEAHAQQQVEEGPHQGSQPSHDDQA